MRYSIYEIASGTISRTVEINDVAASIHDQLQPGEWYVAGTYPDEQFIVEVTPAGLDVVDYVPEIDLDKLKAELVRFIDGEAAGQRSRHITLAAGMELIYAKNESDALWFVAHADDDPAPTEIDVPALAAIAAAYGLSLWQAAQVVLANAAAWLEVHQQIELLRLPAKSAVEAATTPEEARAAANIDWSIIP